ncbi:threonine synthase [Anaerotignum sp. MSJ-24]|uniref:threonine synthase n=1 Tax=Anaerotignum sp. MSJ-24 TaxID=2841521 RepID=UPI001C10C0F2|nr:threonine synthase [Anaerotignum sp. MSJ-24]MBU5464528.1 threonine synthase [Anaerotignum sp. MSJ-24]
MKNVTYIGTRDKNIRYKASEAILKGICPDGGLFIPEEMPVMEKSIEELTEMDYRNLAYEVMSLFFTDFTEDELRYCINNAYDSKFDTDKIAPVVEKDGVYFLELFHGKTIAFKDMALSILPYLMKTSAKKNNIDKEIVILTATSGDTGKAALEGFADVEGTRIIVFYPDGGVSPVQRMQMVTQKGKNVCVAAITGNFDDAQSAVKSIFTDAEMIKELDNKGFMFSSANSINIGRLIPQVAYYWYAYCQLVKDGKIKVGDKINFTVPTGNFGNILAGYFAKKMGLPVNKFVCASNSNKVLYDFFKTGTYDKNREFILTTSPSMDILISSNLERLVCMLTSQEETAKLMKSLAEKGEYSMTAKADDIVGEYADEEETATAIRTMYTNADYVLDTHTAVAYAAYNKYIEESGDTTPTVIVSTASPYKFAKDVCTAIDEKYKDCDPFELMKELEKISGVKIPAPVVDIEKREILHNNLCEREKIKDFVRAQLNK